ncbi:carbohydrate ABC transporter permease [Micromonospora inositola]|uniref:Carbohydrate ABC transporter membrane protein 2, CUT1 family n=1 Tax=Micromonospora inositola TaxID=47865 RepID=A0A1C5JNN0_9ACTN|nr:carbohydrate ABC transporter permease [Micromonospora inositola]SCG72195.1 carbohydrate ABC transporter membrane protein 2, CUT1 family [Micromonospora inositola]
MNTTARTPAYWVRTVAVALVGLAFFLPLLWVVAASVRPGSETFSRLSPISWDSFVTLTPTFQNYLNLLDGDLGRATLNSILVSAVTVAVGLLVCAMAAFALSAFQFRGQTLVFAVVVLSFLIPFDAIAIPLADIFRDWNLTNTFVGLVLPGIGNGMAIFLLRQFFLAIPRELVEAGRLDGLGWLGIFTLIYLPLSRPALIGAGLTLFLFQWQSYVWPLLIGTDREHILGPVALASMQGQNVVDYGLVFAGAVVLTLIPLVVIVMFQRYFIQSVSSSGLK